MADEAHANWDTAHGPITALAELPRGALLSRKDLCRILGCCDKSIRRHVKAGTLLAPTVIPPRRHMWLVGDLLDFFSGRCWAETERLAEERRRLARFLDS
jgi:hypothetical protein